VVAITVGIIGAGAIARDHVAACRRIPGVQIGWVADLDAGRARDLALLAGGAAWTTNPAQIYDAPDVDAVDICTSSASHAALTIAAATAGKAVHVEKPAALSLADFDAMAAAIDRAGVPFMVGQTARFQPVHREVAAGIAEGLIGRPRLLHVLWYAGHVWSDGWRSWQLDPVRSGGHPVHNGVHALDLAVWLLDANPVRVFARGFRTFAPAMGTPDSFHMTVRFDNGALAVLEIAYALRARGDALRRILAVGETGSLHHTTEDDPTLHSDATRAPSPAVEDALYYQLSHWIAVLRGAEEPIVRPAQVRAALAAALGAQESLVSGAAVALGEAVHA
jgi:predicted dehydrogenase